MERETECAAPSGRIDQFERNLGWETQGDGGDPYDYFDQSFWTGFTLELLS